MAMTWQTRLKKLEDTKQWDEAIAFMQKIIENNPHDKDAYIAMNYLIMNLLVEEDHDCTKHDYYETQLKKYFDQSYAQFSEDPEYLFYTAKTAVMSEWYFGIEWDDVEKMFDKAIELAPDNDVYKMSYYLNLDRTDPSSPAVLSYARKFFDESSDIVKTLKQKGSIGQYLLLIHSEWAKDVIKNHQDISSNNKP